MNKPEQQLIDAAVLLAQELQEIVDDAIEASDNPHAMSSTQELLKDWEAAYAACGFYDDERFAGLRRAIDAEAKQ